MLAWMVAGGAGVLGWALLRFARVDAHREAGEVVDMRSLLPEGDGDCRVRVLPQRLYRVELHVEASLENGIRPQWPLRTTLTRITDEGDQEVLYDAERPLLELSNREIGGTTVAGGHERIWGAFPLIEFASESIVRVRFEASLSLGEEFGGACSRIDKASLVVREDVRPSRRAAGRVDRISIDESCGGERVLDRRRPLRVLR